MTEDEFNILMIDRDEREEILKRDFQNLQKEYDESDERWHAEVLELESAKSKLEERAKTLEGSVKDGNIISELRTQVEDADMLCDELEKEKRDLLKQISELRLTSSTTTTDNNIHTEIVSRNNQLENQIVPLQEEVSLLRSKLKLVSSKTDSSTDMCSIKRELEKSKDINSNLNMEIVSLKAQVEPLRQQMLLSSTDQSDVVQSLREEIVCLKEEAAAERNLFDSTLLTGDQSTSLQTQVENLTSENNKLQSDVNHALILQQENNNAITTLQSENRLLKTTVADLNDKTSITDTSKKEIKTLQSKITSLERKLSDSVMNITKISEERSKLRETLKEFENQKSSPVENYEDIENLTEELSNLKNDLKIATDEAAKLQKQKLAGTKREEKLTSKVRSQANELSAIRTKFRKAESDCKKLEKKIISIEADVEDQKSTTESLIQRKEGLKKDNARLNEEVIDWKTKCKRMLRKMENDKDKKRKAFNLLQRVKGQENLRLISDDMNRYSLATVRCRALSTVPQREGEYDTDSSSEQTPVRAKSTAPPSQKVKRRPVVISPSEQSIKRPKPSSTTTSATTKRSKLTLRI